MPIQKISREEILNRSLLVILKQGYHKTTMDDLAKACGLFKGSFYYYFSSKEALMEAVLQTGLAYAENHVFVAAYDHSLTPEARLQRLFEAQRIMLLTGDGGCLFGNSVLETAAVIPEFRAVMAAFFDHWEAALMAIYTAVLPESAARSLAIKTMSAVEGALILAIIRSDYSYLDAAFADAKATFQQALPR